MTPPARLKGHGKWVDGLGPGTPVVEAASTILSLRLRGAAELLPLAQAQADEDIEYVHQLRVRTRRADSALRAFQTAIKPKQYVRVMKALRRIRRAAGLARICDVHAGIFGELRAECARDRRPAADFLLKRNAVDRAAAQKAIDEVARRYPPDKLDSFNEKLLSGLRDPGRKTTLLDVAVNALPDLIQEVRRASLADMSVYDHMHNLRLEGKRMRYAMELFAPCFEPELKRDFYPLVQEMQDYLGSINDTHEIICRMCRWHDDTGMADEPDEVIAGLAKLDKSYRRQLEGQRARFLEFWSQFGIAGLLGGLEQLLAREPVA